MGLFLRKNNKETWKTGLVMSGGGTRGFAHLGVLKALDENGLRPDVICGVSAGAIAGALYADGKSPEEILEILTSQKVMKYLSISIPRQGFIKMSGLQKTLDQYLHARNIEELSIKLKIFAVNINTGEYTCFEEGPLTQALIASSSIPILFAPVKIDGNLYADGGLVNNFPVEPLVGNCKKIIGVNVNPLKETRNLGNIKKIVERAFQIAMRYHTIERRKFCDLFIEPEGIENYGLVDISSGKETFRLGYDEAIKALNQVGWIQKKQAIN